MYCHCTICRRISGAPVHAGLVIPAREFRVISGEPTSFQSSDHGTRYFCSSCGTPLHCSNADSEYVSVPIGTLDEPAAIAPRIHQWTDSRLDWFEITDDLPRVRHGTLPHPSRRNL